MPVQAAPSRDAAPSRAAASAPIKTREQVLEAVKSGAFPLKDNERDSLRNRSTPLCGSPLRSLYTLLILPIALTRIVLFIVVFTSTGCTAALAACLPARSCGRRCLLAIAMRGIRAGLFCLGYHYIKQTGHPSKEAKLKDLFEFLSFDVLIKRGLQRDEIYSLAEEFAKKDHTHFDTFVVIFMSFCGRCSEISCADGRNASLEHIMEEFRASR